jgi:hypothetical protein
MNFEMSLVSVTELVVYFGLALEPVVELLDDFWWRMKAAIGTFASK